MKSIMLSIKPRFCELIASGKKTIEVRKTKPKIKTPFKCYIYCTKDKYGWFDFLKNERLDGKVIGEFMCNKILDIQSRGINENYDYFYLSLNVFGNDDIAEEITCIEKACISREELNKYGEGRYHLYGLYISDLVIYDKPKELSEFMKPCVRSNEWEHIKCYGCEELIYGFGCGRTLLRPPQSWCYVEESEEK